MEDSKPIFVVEASAGEMVGSPSSTPRHLLVHSTAILVVGLKNINVQIRPRVRAHMGYLVPRRVTRLHFTRLVCFHCSLAQEGKFNGCIVITTTVIRKSSVVHQ